MVFSDNKRLLGGVRKAIEKYGMIQSGDKIAVGLSGGKDSLSLLTALYSLKAFYPVPFELCAVHIDAGFDGDGIGALGDFCGSLGIEYEYVKTDIKKIVFDLKKEENPCSLCSRMRRAALCGECEKLGVNKLALGHHFDDAVETFLLNLFFEGRIGVFSPVTSFEDRGVTVIRPLICVKEKEITSYLRKNPVIPVFKNNCPEDKNTEREEIKKYLSAQEKKHKGFKHRIFKAIEKGRIDGFYE